jgi:hypothetical protein
VLHGTRTDNGNSSKFPLSVQDVKKLLTATVLALSSLSACSEEPPTRATRPTDAVGSLATPPPEISCKELCERATHCGTDLLEKSIKAVPGEVALLSRVRDEAPKTIAACTAQCASDVTTLPTTRECLTQTSCELFAECMDGVTPAPR